jgi:hypothetical protein
VQLRAKQVDPEIPIRGDHQEPLADADKAARRCGEATLVVPDEADNVAERRVRLPIC